MVKLAQPSSPHVADDLLLKANGLWEEAEKKSAAAPAVLKGVQISRLSVDYAIVERVRLEAAGRLPLNGDLKSLAHQRFEPYLRTLEISGVLFGGVPLLLENYRKDLAAGLGITTTKQGACVMRVTIWKMLVHWKLGG